MREDFRELVHKAALSLKSFEKVTLKFVMPAGNVVIQAMTKTPCIINIPYYGICTDIYTVAASSPAGCNAKKGEIALQCSEQGETFWEIND